MEVIRILRGGFLFKWKVKKECSYQFLVETIDIFMILVSRERNVVALLSHCSHRVYSQAIHPPLITTANYHTCCCVWWVKWWLHELILTVCHRSKKRESVPDLAPLLWNSFGTIAALLQEIINIYPAINPATLTAHQSNRVCNALALLQVR